MASSKAVLYALAAGVQAAVNRGAGLVIDGCDAVHLAADGQHDLVKLPTPACGVMPGHLSIRRLRAVHAPVSCGKCLRMTNAGQTYAPRRESLEPVLPGFERIAA